MTIQPKAYWQRCIPQDPRDRVYNEDTVSEDMLEFLQAFLEGTHLHMLYHQSTLVPCICIHTSNVDRNNLRQKDLVVRNLNPTQPRINIRLNIT